MNVTREVGQTEAGWLTSRLQSTVETVGSAVLVAEAALLLMGVVFRYFLQRPLLWGDELASLLFIWLGMLGSVAALMRSQHMRLTSFVRRLPQHWWEKFEAFGQVVPAAVLCILLVPAIEYATAEVAVTTPGLGWSNATRAAALPIGIVLMALASLSQLRRANYRNIRAAAFAIGLIFFVLALLHPLIERAGQAGLVVYFVFLLLGTIMSGVPIAFAFAFVTIAYLLAGGHAPFEVIVSRMDEGMSGIILLAVPLFVLLGGLIDITGLATTMVNFLVALLGRARSGLNVALLGAMYLVSGISGSKAADIAAIAPVMVPEMRCRGTDDGEVIALLASSAAMSEIIPPSIVLIAIGSVAGVSISRLFVAGLVPAALLAVVLGLLAWRRAPTPGSSSEKSSPSAIGKAFLIAIPALLLPLLIRLAVSEGVATATEVSTLAIVYCLLVGSMATRKLTLGNLTRTLRDTVALSGTILLVIGTASGMGWALTTSGFAGALTSFMGSLPGGPYGFLLGSILVFIILGSILEGIPAIVLLGPLLFPVAKSLGINDVHYAMVVVLAMGIGLFSPPFGVGYYTACAIARFDPAVGLRHVWPYMASLLISVILLAFVPEISTMFLK